MLIRTLFSAVLLAPALFAAAQAPGYLFFQAEAPLTNVQHKQVIESVTSLDPYAQVFHSDDMTIVQVKSSALLDQASYRGAIQSTGVALAPGLRNPEELGIGALPAVPVFVSTGDDEADMARYRTAVEDWNASHPDQPLSTIPVHRQ
ncbi:MAG: hypothetical protein H6591_08565 [Flavobacteriales bacterium]|nr:hypothetical protein [Flavobacteriales bacterium]